jgi:hypothetical protein
MIAFSLLSLAVNVTVCVADALEVPGVEESPSSRFATTA